MNGLLAAIIMCSIAEIKGDFPVKSLFYYLLRAQDAER